MGESHSRLADMEEIKQLSYRYAWAVDGPELDMELYLGVFTADAVWDQSVNGVPVCRGHEEIGAAYGRNKPLLAQGCVHGSMNHMIEFQDADHATGRSYKLAWAKIDGKTIESFGVFHDTYVRIAGSWRIKSRVLGKLMA